MEAAVANTVSDGMTALVVVNGYFGDRLAQIIERYGATVRRLDVEWGRACDPAKVREELRREKTDVLAFVHAETSTGVLNPAKDLAAMAREHGALTIMDAVTSLGGHELELAELGHRRRLLLQPEVHRRAVGHVADRGLGSPRAQRMVKCRSFYLDLKLLEDYWTSRKYHHTLSTSLIYALREALQMVEEEGLAARQARHRKHHEALLAGVEAMGLCLVPPVGERLWTLNTVRVPSGRGRGGRAADAAVDVQPGGRRRARAAGRQDLARGSDGSQLDAAEPAAVPGRVRDGARDQRLPGAGGRRRGGGAGGAAGLGTHRWLVSPGTVAG